MTGRRVGFYFFAFFAFVAAVNGVMMTLALRTHSGPVTDHPYEKGLAYNQVVEAQKAQDELGWTSEINYENGMLAFTLKDKAQKPITLDKATATFTRPAQQGMDFTVELEGPQSPVSFPLPGAWDVRIDAVSSGVHYQRSKRIIAP